MGQLVKEWLGLLVDIVLDSGKLFFEKLEVGKYLKDRVHVAGVSKVAQTMAYHKIVHDPDLEFLLFLVSGFRLHEGFHLLILFRGALIFLSLLS